MVLTTYLVDREMYDGVMLEMLEQEKTLTSRIGSLPDEYSFSKQGFLAGFGRDGSDHIRYF